jgi:hypothetical protein
MSSPSFTQRSTSAVCRYADESREPGLRDVHRDPPRPGRWSSARTIATCRSPFKNPHELRRRAPARLVLEIDKGERVPVGVADDVTGLAEPRVRVIDRPRRREAAGVRHRLEHSSATAPRCHRNGRWCGLRGQALNPEDGLGRLGIRRKGGRSSGMTQAGFIRSVTRGAMMVRRGGSRQGREGNETHYDCYFDVRNHAGGRRTREQQADLYRRWPSGAQHQLHTGLDRGHHRSRGQRQYVMGDLLREGGRALRASGPMCFRKLARAAFTAKVATAAASSPRPPIAR